jgi:hypothetical protein
LDGDEQTFSSLTAEPVRACGTLSARQKGKRKRTRFRAESTVADRPCKTVRSQLARNGRAPRRRRRA